MESTTNEQLDANPVGAPTCMAYEAIVLAEKLAKGHIQSTHRRLFADEGKAYQWVNCMANALAKQIGKTYKFVRGTSQLVEADMSGKVIQRIGQPDELWYDTGAYYEMRLRLNQSK